MGTMGSRFGTSRRVRVGVLIKCIDRRGRRGYSPLPISEFHASNPVNRIEKGVGMTSRVTVRVTGRIGIDDADRLLTDLAKETDLDWREEHSPDDGHLAGVGELLLTAMISGAAGKGAEVMVEATVDRVREAIGRWRDRRLDPPGIEVRTQELPEDEPAPGLEEEPGAGEAED